MAEQSLLRQVQIEKKRRELELLQAINMNDVISGKYPRSEVIKMLLPAYDMQEKPRLFHDSIKPDKILIGAYGSGKSFTGGAEASFLSWANRPYPGLVIIQTKSNVEVTTIETFKEHFRSNAISYREIDEGTYTVLEVDWGDCKAKIYCASGFSPDFLKGPTFAWGWIDEPFVQKKATMEVGIARIRHPKAVINETMLTGTIEPLQMSWGHELVEDDYHGDEKTFKIVISIYENKYATPQYIERLERMYDEDMQQVYLHGKNHTLRGSVAYRYSEKNKRRFEDLVMPKGIIKLVLGIDFNVNPMTAAELLLADRIRKQIDEYVIENSNTEELCQLVINRFREKYPGVDDRLKKFNYSIAVTMDASARQRRASAKIGVTDAMIVKRMFESSGFNVTIYIPNENPPVRDRVNLVNNGFDKEEFLICDNCKKSILDRRLTKWKEGADGFALDKKGGRSHISEAADYGYWYSERLIEADADESGYRVRTGKRRTR